MTTDYQKLTIFEAAAVCLIVVGVALISFQIFIALPEDVQIKLSSSMQILDVKDAAVEVVSIQQYIVDFAMSGTEDFYKEFYVASAQVLSPTIDTAQQSLASLKQLGGTLAMMADYMATAQNNNQNNLVQSGVEDTFGGRVMGAYFEKLEFFE